jgi:hypothetical protein
MANVHCLGCGLVGTFVVNRLANLGHVIHVHEITEPPRLDSCESIHVHLGDAIEHSKHLKEFGDVDFVVNMLPGDLGHQATINLVDGGYRIIDLSFSEITPDKLHETAKETGARLLWDVGIAPGLSNMLIAYAARKGEGIVTAEVRVGGNPSEPDSEWSYMAPFSPSDVIAEYTRPARIIRDRMESILPALSERHRINVEGKGEMEAFLTDGLRSLLDTIPAQDMAEYTVRWPGHIQRYIDEKKSGRLDSKSLILEWKFDQNRPEFTWMEVKVDCENGEFFHWIIEDHGGSDGSSMARTTGLVTSSCVNEWANSENIIEEGSYPPEILSDTVICSIIQTMKDSGVEIRGPDIQL